MAELIPKSKDLYFVNGINDPGKFGTKTPTGNSRLYNCKQCDRAFTRRDLLLRHAKNLHQGSELAVPRIRKQLKTLDCEESIVDFKLEEERLEDDRLDLEKLEDDVVLPLPQTKRLKLSVDMLVS